MPGIEETKQQEDSDSSSDSEDSSEDSRRDEFKEESELQRQIKCLKTLKQHKDSVYKAWDELRQIQLNVGNEAKDSPLEDYYSKFKTNFENKVISSSFDSILNS